MSRWMFYSTLRRTFRNLHGMSQICQALVEKGAHPEIVTKAVYFAASMAFDLEQKYDAAFPKAAAARQAEEQIEA